jgi:hypothetical protein
MWAAVLGAAAALIVPDVCEPSVRGVLDPREGSGKLDIRSAGHGHAGATSVTQRLATYYSFPSTLLRSERSIAFALYSRPVAYPDRWVFVSWQSGALRAVIRDNEGKVIAPLPVSRPSSRSVRVEVPKLLLGDPPAYRWVAFTTGPTGTDATLEGARFPQTGARAVRAVVHDYTAPAIRLFRFPDPSTNASASLAYPVAFAVRDQGFAGMRAWRLDRRVSGSAWLTLARGKRPGIKQRILRGLEGLTYEHQVVAVDRHGNRARSPVALVSVPLDDTNTAFVASFSGAWTAFGGSPGHFLDTLHVSSEARASFSYAFTGSHVAWIAPATAGNADVQIDGGPPEAVDLAAFSGHRQVVFARELAPGPHTVTITVVGGSVAIDALVVRGSAGTPASTRALTAEELDGLLHADAPPPARWPVLATRFAYTDSWRGWPVAPLHAQHPIRGSFLDPRPTGFHFGIDINVRDDRPERGTPPNRTHRVYAVEGGVVGTLHDASGSPCDSRDIWVGHFAYYHVDAVVGPGQRVRPGQVIGWTCKGLWHVHLSEWVVSGGRRILVNPLHPGGKLAPYTDRAPPIVHALRFFRPSGVIWIMPGGAMWSPVTGMELAPDRLSGIVDVRAWISDRQSFRGWFRSLPSFYAAHMPTRVQVRVVRARDGKVVLSRIVFDGRTFLYGMGFNGFYGMGTVQNLSARECYRVRALAHPPRECEGRYVLHVFARRGRPYWDTRTLANGSYRLQVRAWDARGNVAAKAVPVTIAN